MADLPVNANNGQPPVVLQPFLPTPEPKSDQSQNTSPGAAPQVLASLPVQQQPVPAVQLQPTLSQPGPMQVSAPHKNGSAMSNMVDAVSATPVVKFISKDIVLEMLFLIGFASIFLINSLNAWIAPQDFIKLLAANPISKAVGHYDIMIKIIMVNDMIIGLLLLSRWKKKFVWAYAGLWLIIVAGIKTLYLLFLK